MIDYAAIFMSLVIAGGITNPPKLVMSSCKAANAVYNYQKHTVIVCRGFVNVLRNRDEVAVVLGHELAHSQGIMSETRADIRGVDLANKAGYNACNGIKFLQQLGDRGGIKHPPSIRRYKFLRGKTCG